MKTAFIFIQLVIAHVHFIIITLICVSIGFEKHNSSCSFSFPANLDDIFGDFTRHAKRSWCQIFLTDGRKGLSLVPYQIQKNKKKKHFQLFCFLANWDALLRNWSPCSRDPPCQISKIQVSTVRSSWVKNISAFSPCIVRSSWGCHLQEDYKWEYRWNRQKSNFRRENLTKHN